MDFSYEERVWKWLEHQLCEQSPEICSGRTQIIVEEVCLEHRETAEETIIIILFRVSQRPECLFGFRTDPSPVQVITPDGGSVPDQDPEGHAQVLYVNLKETVEAADMGLPDDCITDDITWI